MIAPRLQFFPLNLRFAAGSCIHISPLIFIHLHSNPVHVHLHMEVHVYLDYVQWGFLLLPGSVYRFTAFHRSFEDCTDVLMGLSSLPSVYGLHNLWKTQHAWICNKPFQKWCWTYEGKGWDQKAWSCLSLCTFTVYTWNLIIFRLLANDCVANSTGKHCTRYNVRILKFWVTRHALYRHL